MEWNPLGSHFRNAVHRPYYHAGNAYATSVWAWCNTKVNFDANWQLIKQQKQNLINKNNAKENSKRTPHDYKVKDLVLVKNEQSTKFGKDAYNGPWMIQEVRDNGTVKISKGPVSDVYNIWNITPYIN